MPKILNPGDRFGKLVVLYWQQDKSAWHCRCDCGNELNISTYALTVKEKKSCACSTRLERKYRQLADNLALKRGIISNYIGCAKKRNYCWLLSEEDALSLISSRCAYCNIEPSMKRYARRRHAVCKDRFVLYNGIDRVDNSLGYIKENCVTACHLCNRSKATSSVDDWYDWIKRLYKNLNLDKF